jgi:hypothetical protein
LDEPTGLEQAQWNHLARNLFEILGELMPDNNRLARAAAEVALRYLNPELGAACYVSYKTRYNVARCLERIHFSAPRPYYDHTLKFHSLWRTTQLDEHLVGGWVIRGFHLTKQEPRPAPPTVFNDRRHTPPRMLQIEAKVSEGLLRAVEQMDAHELPEDAGFMGINCTHALIRWLPQKPDLARLQRLLAHHHTSMPMKQNVFWALYNRFRSRIPDCFRGQGYFAECGELSWYDGKSCACEEALRVYVRLLRAEPKLKKARRLGAWNRTG